MRFFIRCFLKIQFDFLFLSKCKILGDLRQPGRKAASFLAVFWQRFAGTFMQNLLVFLQHCWVALTNKSSFLLSLLLSSDMQISVEIQRGHTFIWEQRLWFFFLNTSKGIFSGKKAFVPGEDFVIVGSRLALSDTLTSPLAHSVSTAAGASFSQREQFHSRAGELQAYLFTEYK